MILADKIMLERKKNGWSQEELADRLGVSRQSVSKWEGAQAVPDLNRVLQMSEVFGVSTDYLLRDDSETESEFARREENATPLRRVGMEEAQAFLAYKKRAAGLVSFGVMMCVFSAVPLLLLLAVGVPHKVAVAVGIALLLALVAAAVGIFIYTREQGKPYEYLDTEAIDTEYGVAGMARDKNRRYRDTHTARLIGGVVLCIVSAVPPVLTGLGEAFPLGESFACALLLTCVAAGVGVIVNTSVIRSGFLMLAEEGEWSPEGKRSRRANATFTSVWWSATLAGYLAYSFLSGHWHRSWIVWPVSAVLFGAAIALRDGLRKPNNKNDVRQG